MSEPAALALLAFVPVEVCAALSELEVCEAEDPALEAAPEAVDAEPPAADDEPLALVAAAEAADPEAEAELEVEFAAAAAPFIAAAWKAENDFSAVGFTAKTIPFWQWILGVVCAQKNQRGAETSVMLTENCMALVAPTAIAWKPESNPPLLTQGLANVD